MKHYDRADKVPKHGQKYKYENFKETLRDI